MNVDLLVEYELGLIIGLYFFCYRIGTVLYFHPTWEFNFHTNHYDGDDILIVVDGLLGHWSAVDFK